MLVSDPAMTSGNKERASVQFTPFPDLTGWRSSAANRGNPAAANSSRSIHATYQYGQVSLDLLKKTAGRMAASEPEDFIIGAWIIVLIHLFSQQDDIDVHVNIYPLQHIHLSLSGDKRDDLTISSLLGHIKKAKAKYWQEEEFTQLADNAVLIDLTASPSEVAHLDSTLFFSASCSKEGNQPIHLSLDASLMVHSQESAQMHLSQVAACLVYLCEASANDAALSLHCYPSELLAGDNPLPQRICDDTFQQDLLHERFEHQMERIVSRHSQAVALDFRANLDAPSGDESAGNILWTYQELDRRATILGHVIKSHLKKEFKNLDTQDTEIVALCLEKSPFTYLSILAVLKAGAAWCPIDTDWPTARQEALLAKSGANLVLTVGDQVSRRVEEILPSTMSTVRIDTIDYSLDVINGIQAMEQQRSTSDALAYLIWTSGTTGLPKAVGIQHKSAVQALRALQRVIPHNEFDFRYLQFSAYNFDLMILDMFYTWGLGGTLCTSSRSMLLTNLISLSNTLEVTHTLLTPAVMAMTPRQAIPSLQVVINGGEKLSQVVADNWSVNCCLLNLYGPAEATLIAMNRRVTSGDQVKAPNIGRALATTSCHALDERDEIILKGAVGQLVLGGHQCALGYIGEPDKTRDKFVQHPQFGQVYKTGDLVRQLWNGDFEYLGRSDDQIKINGIRIEMLGINAIMRSALEDVMFSETLLIQSSNLEADDDVQIVNFSVFPLSHEQEEDSVLFRTDDEAATVARHLIEFANAKLPTYMIPSLFIIVSRFPRTSSAKIDRQALQKELARFDRLAWVNRLVGLAENNETDWLMNPQEEKIRLLITELCGISSEGIGRHTPFPTLGLNSIKAITLSHRLQKVGIAATVVDIVQYQTLATLVERINTSSSKSADRSQKAIKKLEMFNQQHNSAVKRYLQDQSSSLQLERVSPVTPLQEALLSETIRDKSRYWLHRCYNLPSTINEEKLQHAIQSVVDSVDILRTCFVEIGQITTNISTKDIFAQAVLSSYSINVEIIDKVEDDDWNSRVIETVQKKLNLQAVNSMPPVGFLIVKGNSPKLVAVLHHSLYDQVTLGLLESAFSRCYSGDSRVFDSIKSFSLGLKHLITCDEEEENLRRQEWERLLSVYPKRHAVSFPNLSGKDTVSNDITTSRYHQKTHISFSKVTSSARDLQTSVRPILQAAWASILYAHCDTTDVILGDSVSGRAASIELDNVAGPILDTLPIPICISTTYRKVISSLDNFHKAAMSNQPVPLRHIRGIVEIPKEFPLFASVFVFEPPQELEVEKGDTSRMFEDSRDFGISVEHSVAVEVSISSDGHLDLGMVARDAVISSSYAKLILAQWECAIRQAIEDPDSDASDHSKFFSGDLLSVSHYSVPASLETAQRVPVSSALGKWAELTPDAVAVEFFTSLDGSSDGFSRLTKTYRELEQEAKQVAHILTNKLASKSIIAVSLHRSMETYVVLLGILLAGMTYLPIDPTLPATRKTNLITNSRAACLVCSSSTQWSLTEPERSIFILQVDSNLFADTLHLDTYQKVETDMSTPAYIIFTSGSTGTPKGCVLTQKNLSSTIEAFRLTFEEKAPDTLDQTTRFLARSVEAFDVAILEALLPLQVGGAIITGPRELILQDMKNAMQVMQITHAAVVPSLFFSQGHRILPQDLPHLRALIVGGERIAKDIIKAWAPSDVSLLNAYGPTEACIGNSVARLGVQDSTSVIGKPFYGTRYVVLKDGQKGLRPTLRGEAGELFIAGLQVGSYLEKQSQFKSFVQWNGQRFYRTGDEVRLRQDDVTEYLGRSSNNQNSSQVKIRGVRIELSEVDDTLLKAAKVSRFCTTRLIGQPPYLVTFMATQASNQNHEEGIQESVDTSLQEEAIDLLQKMKVQLPSYMVPRLIIAVESIPLSLISGKIDGKRLEEWYLAYSKELLWSDRHSKKGMDRELDKAETIVKEEIQRLFKIDTEIGPYTDIFSLGLDSLNVITLSSVLNKRGIAAAVAHIMAHPTVEEIARGVGLPQQEISSERFDFTEQVMTESGLNIIRACPLLPLQESMITQTLANGSVDKPRYINFIRLICKRKQVDSERLKHSIEETLNSHRIYKTVFLESQGRLLQAVLQAKPLWLLSETDFEKHALEDISTKIDRIPPLRYCGSSSNEVLFAIHHAIYDGESLTSLLEEIHQRYDGHIPQSRSDFVDYVNEVRIPSQEAKLNTWEKRLHETTASLLPCLTGKKPSQDDSSRRQEAEHKLSTSLSQLQELARGERVTLQLLILNAFASLYSQYVGQDQVLFGVVLGGRTGRNQQVHGPCINTVPFSYLNKKEGWQKQIQTIYAEAISNQHISIPALCRRLQIQGNLFNSLFSYLGTAKKNKFFEEVSSQLLTEYPFAVEVQEIPDTNEMEFRAVFDAEHIPAAQVSLFLQQMEMSISSKARSIESSCSKLLSIENEVPHVPSQSDSFLQYFHRQVEQNPDGIAFVFSHNVDLPNEEISYRRLDEMSSQIAKKLVTVLGSVIGVLLKQCPALYSVVIAIWKAGKVYLPLDPSLPLERLEYMTSIAKPNLIISAKERIVLADSLGCRLSLEDLMTDQQPSSTSELLSPTLNNAAYIMFTSGSSGKPKGVQISHLALASAIYSWSQILPYSKQSRMLQLASPGFDVFLIEICMPLALGYSFASAAKEDLLNDLEFTFSKLQLTMADLPAVLAATVRTDRILNSNKFDWLMSGGDIIDDGVIRQWSSHGLINAWGPTETTIGNTLGFVSETSSRNWVGKAYPTSSIYILEATNRDIAFRGCIGEIAVGGPQVADCYVGNPDLTVEKFINLQNGARVYRTGDRGRLLIDGSLECLGRIDSGQVKVNSQRVELGEIELQLKRHEEILDALVLYIKHPELQSKQLVAFLIVKKGLKEGHEDGFRQDQESATQALASLDEAGNHLAPYMIPSFCLVMAGKRLPLTPNNKVDSKRVQATFNQMTAKEIRKLDVRSSLYQSSQLWTKLEKELQFILARFCDLNEEEVERDVSFYRLGIDSISGYQLLKRLKEGNFNQLSLRDILKAQTIASLAKLIQAQQKGNKESGSSILVRLEREFRLHCDATRLCLTERDCIVRLLPCTPLQEGLLVESLNSGLYVHHHLFKVDESRLSSVPDAIQGLVDSHDILKTSFHLINGQFVQAVHTDVKLQMDTLIETVDLQEAVSKYTLENSVGDEANLARPPFRVQCFQSKTDKTVILDLVLHHALYDGETLEMIFAEIESRVKGSQVKSRPSFKLLLPHILSRPEDERFFVEQIGDCTSTLLGQTNTSSSSRPCFSSRRTLKITTRTLANFASNAGVSVHVVALFAFSELLAHLTEQRDVVFAQLFSLRDATQGAEDVIGPALNIVLTRITLFDDEVALEALSRLQSQDVASRDHRSVSMAQVLRQSKRNRGGQPIEFDTLFDFQRSATSETFESNSSDKILTPWGMQEDTATQYALNVQFKQQGDSISLTAVGDSDVFLQDGLDRNLELLEEILVLTVDDGRLDSNKMPGNLSNLTSLPVRASVLPTVASKSARSNGIMKHSQELPKEQTSLVEAISELLQMDTDSIDIGISIAQLGLDSIMAIRLASLLRTKGISVGVADILQGKTVEGISQRIAKKNKDASLNASQSNGHTLEIAREDKNHIANAIGVFSEQIEVVLPLLPGQKFELSEYIHSKGESGIFTFLYKIKAESVEKAKMEVAWNNLRARHDILRTCFMIYKGKVCQVLLSNVNDTAWKTETLTRSMSSLLKREFEWNDWIVGACPVDPNLLQPVCAACFVSAPDGNFFAIRLHHCLYDAWTISILMQDFAYFYRNNKLEEVPRHSELVKHICSEKALLTNKAEKYWKDLLKGVSPCFFGNGAQQVNHEIATLSVYDALIGASNAERILKNARINLGTAFIAAWSRCLLRIFESNEKVVFGLYHRGRTSDFSGIEKVASNCMNVLPLVIKRADDTNMVNLCSSVKNQMDDQVEFESTSSMNEILTWTESKETRWNTYLNLVWDQGQQEPIYSSQLFEAVSSPEKKENGKVEWKSDWTNAQIGEMKSDVNTNLHWDRIKDGIDVFIRYRDDICSDEEMQQIVKEMISTVKETITGC